MRTYLLCTIIFILSGCDAGQVKSFLHSRGAKQLAKAGETVLAQAAQAVSISGKSVAQDVPDVALVNGKQQVGHRNFTASKKILPDIFSGMEEEFYCGCKYTGKDVDLASCGYVARKNASRAARIEWEHVVPAEHLGSQRQCWQDGGRKNCSGKDPLFDAMEGDLNNLVPAVGEVNGDRSNMSYGAWTSHPEPVYGHCQSIPDFKGKRFQPREEVRGRAARISLYMHTRYGLSISNQDKKLWCAWAKTYPVDTWEIERDKRVVQWQGEGNVFVEEPGKIGVVCG